MSTKIRETIASVFDSILSEQGTETAVLLRDDSILLESGLDSLGFAILVTRLEEELGYDPFSISETAFYPTTFGEFVRFYEQNQPQ